MMKKIFTRPPLRLFFFCLFFCAGPVLALDISGFGEGDEAVIWESGINRYIKYALRDSTEFGPNDHPVTLNREELELALLALQIPDDGFFATDGTLESVFTVAQIKLLSKELPRGFGTARPDQDIILALEKDERKLLGLQDKRFLAARAFFKDGRLNIIIGPHGQTTARDARGDGADAQGNAQSQQARGGCPLYRGAYADAGRTAQKRIDQPGGVRHETQGDPERYLRTL